MDVDGSNVIRLTDDPAAEFMPTWSPTGESDRVRARRRTEPPLMRPAIFTMNARRNRRPPGLERRRRERLLAELVARRNAGRLRGHPERGLGDLGRRRGRLERAPDPRRDGSGLRRQPRLVTGRDPDRVRRQPRGRRLQPRRRALRDATGRDRRHADRRRAGHRRRRATSRGSPSRPRRTTVEPTPSIPPTRPRSSTRSRWARTSARSSYGEGSVWVAASNDDGTSAGTDRPDRSRDPRGAGRHPVEVIPTWEVGGGAMVVDGGSLWVTGAIEGPGTGRHQRRGRDRDRHRRRTRSRRRSTSAETWAATSRSSTATCGCWCSATRPCPMEVVARRSPNRRRPRRGSELDANWAHTLVAADGRLITAVGGDDAVNVDGRVIEIDPATGAISRDRGPVALLHADARPVARAGVDLDRSGVRPVRSARRGVPGAAGHARSEVRRLLRVRRGRRPRDLVPQPGSRGRRWPGPQRVRPGDRRGRPSSSSSTRAPRSRWPSRPTPSGS